MIFLDTSYLIRGLIAGTPQAAQLAEWSRDGMPLITSSLVWCEFVTGPITKEEINLAYQLLNRRVLAFRHEDSLLAAKIFNHLKRPRSKRLDIMIAAGVIIHKATLATANTKDFQPIAPLGLRLF